MGARPHAGNNAVGPRFEIAVRPSDSDRTTGVSAIIGLEHVLQPLFKLRVLSVPLCLSAAAKAVPVSRQQSGLEAAPSY